MTEEFFKDTVVLKPNENYGPKFISRPTTVLDSEFELTCTGPCNKLQSVTVVLHTPNGNRGVPIQLKQGYFKESLIKYLDSDLTFDSFSLQVANKTLDLTVAVWGGPEPGFH